MRTVSGIIPYLVHTCLCQIGISLPFRSIAPWALDFITYLFLLKPSVPTVLSYSLNLHLLHHLLFPCSIENCPPLLSKQPKLIKNYIPPIPPSANSVCLLHLQTVWEYTWLLLILPLHHPLFPQPASLAAASTPPHMTLKRVNQTDLVETCFSWPLYSIWCFVYFLSL